MTHKDKFINNIKLLENFIRINKRTPLAKEGEIGNWYFKLKKKVKDKKLTDYEKIEIENLENLFPKIELFVFQDDIWNKEFELYKKHLKDGGNFYTQWFKNQKESYKKGVLKESKVKALEKISAPLDDNFNESFRDKLFKELLEYKSNNDNMEIPTDYITENGYPLGNKYLALRTRYKHSSNKVNKNFINKLIENGLFVKEYKYLNKSTLNAKAKMPITNTTGFIGVCRINEYIAKDGSVRKAYVSSALKYNKIKHKIGKYEDTADGLLQGAIDRDIYIIEHKLPHTRNFTDEELLRELEKRTQREIEEIKKIVKAKIFNK